VLQIYLIIMMSASDTSLSHGTTVLLNTDAVC